MNEISRLVELSAEIVAAHLSRHDVPSFEISPLIRKVHATLVSLQAESVLDRLPAASGTEPDSSSGKSEQLALEGHSSIYEAQQDVAEPQPIEEIADGDIYGSPAPSEAAPEPEILKERALSPEEDRRDGYVRNGIQSLHDDHLVCLEDGKSVVLMTRHLRSRYGMTPAEYRAKWKLPADYPMTAPNYTAFKRDMALQSGLGKGSKGRPSKVTEVVAQNLSEPSFEAPSGIYQSDNEDVKTAAPTKALPRKKSFLKEALDIFSAPEPIAPAPRKENRPRKAGKLSPVYEG